MEEIISFLIVFIVAACFLLLVQMYCGRCPAIRKRKLVLMLIAGCWCAIIVAKPLYIDKIIPPDDAVLHEEIARNVSENLSRGRYSEALSNFGAGNAGYRFFLGIFYAITNGAEYTSYAVNGLLAFWGTLILLELLCLLTKCVCVPLWLIVLLCGSPSAMFWTTANLKEGIVLWGICLSLRLLLKYDPHCAIKDRGILLPIVGLFVAGYMRPHIAASWLIAMAIGVTLHHRKFGLALIAVIGGVGSLYMLQILAPGVMEGISRDGFVSAMGNEYEARSEMGGSAIQHSTGGPIPVISGLILILLRPFPQEVDSIGALVSGAEVWLISMIALFNWLSISRPLRIIATPLATTMVVSLLLFSLQFTYMYNMGLMVRQRIQIFPAMIALAALPHLVTRKHFRTAARQTAVAFNSVGTRKASVVAGNCRVF